jgi:hypothetical protein
MQTGSDCKIDGLIGNTVKYSPPKALKKGKQDSVTHKEACFSHQFLILSRSIMRKGTDVHDECSDDD